MIIEIKKVIELLYNLASRKFHGELKILFTDGVIVKVKEDKELFK